MQPIVHFSLSDSLGVGLTTLPRARRAYYDIYQPTLYSIVIELESHVLEIGRAHV